MNKIFSTLAVVALAVSAARAQSEALSFSARAFEAQAAEAVAPFILEDSFAGIGACAVLDAKTFRAWTLDEAAEKAAPCLQEVGRRYSAEVTMQAGILSASQGQPARPGLILKTELIPGSKPHRDMIASLDRRHGMLLGHRVLLLARGQVAPTAVSAVQGALKQCIMTDVVREIRTGADFVKIYGACLTRNPDLKIDEIRPGTGLTVNMKTEVSANNVEAMNGFVTVNAGAGPVSVMIIAYGAQTAMP